MAKIFSILLLRIVAWLRIAAWIVFVLGGVFAVLQAYLVGVPGLIIGGGILWITRGVVPPVKKSGWAPARATSLPVDDPWSIYLPESNLAGNTYLEPNDQNPYSPLFRSMSEQVGHDVRDYTRD